MHSILSQDTTLPYTSANYEPDAPEQAMRTTSAAIDPGQHDFVYLATASEVVMRSIPGWKRAVMRSAAIQVM